MSKHYTVVIEGTFREVYHVPADSENEARDTWMDYKAAFNEATEAEIVSVKEGTEWA